MSGQSNNDETLDDLEDVLDTDSTDDGAGADSDEDQGPDSDADAEQDEDKRVNDLMSKWQKEQARANSLQKQLDGKGKDADGAGAEGADGSAEVRQWIELMRLQARGQVFTSDPRFATYGIDQGSIEGQTPTEMQESATRLSGLIDRMETSMRDSLLKKHGLSPEVKSVPAGNRKGYAEMTDDEFEKTLARAKNSW